MADVEHRVASRGRPRRRPAHGRARSGSRSPRSASPWWRWPSPSYLTVTHYSDPTALACPDTGIVNCTLVTTSSWSVVLGVPLAVLGLVWAVVMTGLTVPWAWRAAAPWVDGARLVVSGAGAAMVLYLVYVELFRIGAICLWCTAMHVTAVCLFGVILAGRAASSNRDPAVS